MSTTITVETLVTAPIEKVWNYWTEPTHIKYWNFASDDWCAPNASNHLVVGGKFSFRMEAKDGSFGFDLEGVYDLVDIHKRIEYTLADGRKVKIEFTTQKGRCKVLESFEAELENSKELQRSGWQAILNNFKKYTESN
ncbi:MAG: SRPBCC family protein [Bacteroidota bacterium]